MPPCLFDAQSHFLQLSDLFPPSLPLTTRKTGLKMAAAAPATQRSRSTKTSRVEHRPFLFLCAGLDVSELRGSLCFLHTENGGRPRAGPGRSHVCGIWRRDGRTDGRPRGHGGGAAQASSWPAMSAASRRLLASPFLQNTTRHIMTQFDLNNSLTRY